MCYLEVRGGEKVTLDREPNEEQRQARAHHDPCQILSREPPPPPNDLEFTRRGRCKYLMPGETRMRPSQVEPMVPGFLRRLSK